MPKISWNLTPKARAYRDELRQTYGGGWLNKKQVMKEMGVKDYETINKFLADLDSTDMNGHPVYSITDLAARCYP